MPLPTGDRDMLAHAVNERLAELAPTAPAPYSHPLREGRPPSGPLAAFVDLLDGAHLATPEDLPAVVAAAGRALGTDIVVYLVDYAQRELAPLAAADATAGRERLGVDGTLAGRAFRSVEVLASDSDGQPRLWVPLIDGAERLGVLEVLVGDVDDLNDPVLRDQLRWLSAQIAHLVTALGAYGDSLEGRHEVVNLAQRRKR